jgi:hypothetical protein
MKGLTIATIVILAFQVRLPLRLVGGSGGGSAVLDAAHIQYVGSKQVAFASESTWGAGQVSGYRSGGVLHFLVIGDQRNLRNVDSTAVSGASTTQFTVASGVGAQLTNNAWIDICRKAAGVSGVGCKEVYPEDTKITNISGDVITVSPALGGIPASGDEVYQEFMAPILDIADDGSSWVQDPASVNTLAITNIIEQPYHGRRGGFDAGNNNVWSALGYITSSGIYVHNGLWYLSWYWSYVSNTTSSNFGMYDPVHDIMYGPWVLKTWDGDGVSHQGQQGCAMLLADPVDSTKFGCTTLLSSGITQFPWGPNLTVGLPWPTSSTSNAFGSNILDFGTSLGGGSPRYIYQYYMGDPGTANYFNQDGTVHGFIRSFRYPTSYNYMDEPRTHTADGTRRLSADPAQNGGVNTFNEIDRIQGAMYFRGTNRQGVIFATNLLGRNAGYSNTSCTVTQHEFYANAGQGYVLTSSGDFSTDTVITGLTTGYSHNLSHWDNTLHLGGWNDCGAGCIGQEFNVGETIQGNISGHTGTVVQDHRNLTCDHGCDASPPYGYATTGPSWRNRPRHVEFLVYDADTLDSVRAGSTTDWTPDPTNYIDFDDTYGYHLLGTGTPGDGTDAEAYSFGFFQDPDDPTYFYIVTQRSWGGGTMGLSKFHILDTAEPEPTLLGWLWEIVPRLTKTHPALIPSLLRATPR